jgi:hypothetical protein
MPEFHQVVRGYQDQEDAAFILEMLIHTTKKKFVFHAEHIPDRKSGSKSGTRGADIPGRRLGPCSDILRGARP